MPGPAHVGSSTARSQLAPIAALAHAQPGWTLLMTGNLVEADDNLRLAEESFDPSWDDWLTWSFGQSVQLTTLAWRSFVA